MQETACFRSIVKAKGASDASSSTAKKTSRPHDDDDRPPRGSEGKKEEGGRHTISLMQFGVDGRRKERESSGFPLTMFGRGRDRRSKERCRREIDTCLLTPSFPLSSFFFRRWVSQFEAENRMGRGR